MLYIGCQDGIQVWKVAKIGKVGKVGKVGNVVSVGKVGNVSHPVQNAIFLNLFKMPYFKNICS